MDGCVGCEHVERGVQRHLLPNIGQDVKQKYQKQRSLDKKGQTHQLKLFPISKRRRISFQFYGIYIYIDFFQSVANVD
jgi:hypothetical protein